MNFQDLARAYETYKDDLLSVAIHLTGSRAAGEDILQEVFVRLARRNQSPAPADLRRFLVQCCLNLSRDLWRRDSARPVDVLTGEEPVVAEGASPLDAAVRTEETERLRQLLLRIPLEQREVVTLHLHGQLTFRAIAELLGVPFNTVMSRYRYGLESLRRRLQPGGLRR